MFINQETVGPTAVFLKRSIPLAGADVVLAGITQGGKIVENLHKEISLLLGRL